jgi:dimethylargininase
MLRNEGHRLTRVVVCSPDKEYFNVKDLQAHNFAAKANPKKAKTQHDLLKSTIKRFGAEVIDIRELDSHPNSAFTRDASLCTPQGYVQLRMGLASRQGEEAWMAQVLEGLKEPRAGRIHAPGTVEGGDVILAGPVAFIGCSKRTNAAGVRQLSSLLEKMGYKIRTADIPLPHLHLGGIMSLVGPRDILCSKGLLDRKFFKDFDLCQVDSETFISANVICLGEGELIAESSNTAAMEALEKKGYKVHALGLSEFVKGSGGPSCLILPVDRLE